MIYGCLEQFYFHGIKNKIFYALNFRVRREEEKQASVSDEKIKFINEDTPFYLDSYIPLYIYGILVFGSVILSNIRNILMYTICKRSSSNIHNMMINCILKTPMRFFDVNPSGKKSDIPNHKLYEKLYKFDSLIPGRLLNRFSKDLGAVDEILSLAFVESFQILSVLIGIMVQVLIINWWLLLPMSIMIFLQMEIKRMYLATAQSVKRLEGNGNYLVTT